jgi:hypothetical protein
MTNPNNICNILECVQLWTVTQNVTRRNQWRDHLNSNVTDQGPQFESRTRQPRRCEDKRAVRHWLVYIEGGKVEFVLVCTRAPARLYE